MLKPSALLGLIVFLAGGVLQAAVDITSNQVGRLTSMGNQFTRTFHQYDEKGRIVATQYVQDGQSRTFGAAYGYPQNSQSTPGPGIVIVRETFPDGERILYTHDAGGSPVTVRSALGASSDDIIRDRRLNARGQVSRLDLGNGTVTTSTYDDAGRLLLSTTVNGGGQKVQEYGYTYDPNGNVTGVADGVQPGQSATFTYDSLDQLTSIRNPSGGVIEAYAYDAIGNLVQKGALTQTYGADGRPHALAASGGIAYGYDANGNVTSIGGNTALQWNAENMSTRVTAGPVVTSKSFVGETLWKKVESGVTTYYMSGMRLENGIPRKYYGAYAERFEESGGRPLRFYHPDHLGSSSVMTDQGGSVIRRASYFPWGQERSVEGAFVPKLQFNFKEKDATGFYDFGARLYSPLTGRWLSPDSSLGDGLNRYAYVRNNPWTRIDPTGHDSQRFWIECIKCGKTYWSPWEGDDIPEGWIRMEMPHGYQRIVDGRDGLNKILLPNGTFDVEERNGNWRPGTAAELKPMTREQAAAMVKAATPSGPGEDPGMKMLGAIGTAVDRVPMALTQAYLGSVAIGVAGGAAAYAATTYAATTVASNVITLGIEGAPVFSKFIPTVIGFRYLTQQFGHVANRLDWSRWTPGVQSDWLWNVLRSEGPVFVTRGGPWTMWEMMMLHSHRWQIVITPHGTWFYRTAETITPK